MSLGFIVQVVVTGNKVRLLGVIEPDESIDPNSEKDFLEDYGMAKFQLPEGLPYIGGLMRNAVARARPEQKNRLAVVSR